MTAYTSFSLKETQIDNTGRRSVWHADALYIDQRDFTFLYNCSPKPHMRNKMTVIGQGIACLQV